MPDLSLLRLNNSSHLGTCGHFLSEFAIKCSRLLDKMVIKTECPINRIDNPRTHQHLWVWKSASPGICWQTERTRHRTLQIVEPLFEPSFLFFLAFPWAFPVIWFPVSLPTEPCPRCLCYTCALVGFAGIWTKVRNLTSKSAKFRRFPSTTTCGEVG